ncbi:MAG: SPASM domain-containing protein [Candidatus Moduliflexus flocculans]|nr:SPASM domain-containing protein [Candidatus Moduliflexus flocculans]
MTSSTWIVWPVRSAPGASWSATSCRTARKWKRRCSASQTLTLETFTFAPGKAELSLPRIDVNNTTKETFFSLFQGFENLTFMGNRIAVDARRCRFVHERTSFVRWDGKVAPCMGPSPFPPDLTSTGSNGGSGRTAFGDVRESDLVDIWNSKAYADFREKVKAFDYSPCHVCGGCSHARVERRGLLREHVSGVRRLPLGPGSHPMPVSRAIVQRGG